MTSTADPITVALVNDYPVVVQGLAGMLAPDRRLRVVELDSMVDPEAAVDLVLFDLFAGTESLGDVARLVGDARTGRVVVYSWHMDAESVADTMEAGARGYLSKALDGPDLADALVRVHGGDVVISPAAAQPDEEHGDWPGRGEGLSARESEVIALITQGRTNEEIARVSYLSINSVKSYIRSAYRKMGVQRRSQAVLWGVEHGMLPRPARSRFPGGA